MEIGKSLPWVEEYVLECFIYNWFHVCMLPAIIDGSLDRCVQNTIRKNVVTVK